MNLINLTSQFELIIFDIKIAGSKFNEFRTISFWFVQHFYPFCSKTVRYGENAAYRSPYLKRAPIFHTHTHTLYYTRVAFYISGLENKNKY